MKKIILFLVVTLFAAGMVYSQPKVNISLSNPGIAFPGGYWKIDVMATVLTGQTWKVGSSNIRVDYVTTPANLVSVHLDNPVSNANSNLSGNANYSVMTTTAISGGISLNIARLGNCFTLTPGTYKLGEIRFNRLGDTTGCVKLTIRPTSVLQDSITQMVNPAGWTQAIDTSCKVLNVLVGNSTSGNEVPKVFKLYTNYPNPFNPSTTIKYDIPKGTFVKLVVFDILGKEVSTLVNEKVEAGRYEANWNASNYASGTYFYKLETESFTDIKKMILVK